MPKAKLSIAIVMIRPGLPNPFLPPCFRKVLPRISAPTGPWCWDSLTVVALALPLTPWEALFERIGLDSEGADAGRRLLILSGAGGVGSIAIQLARRAGLEVIATASRPQSRAWRRSWLPWATARSMPSPISATPTPTGT